MSKTSEANLTTTLAAYVVARHVAAARECQGREFERGVAECGRLAA